MLRVVREVLAADFAGNQARAAEAFGFTPATLSMFLSRKTGVGAGLERGVTRYLRRSFDQIVATGGDLAALRGGEPSPSAPREVRFGDLPNWPSLWREARAVRPELPRWAWVYCARARVILDVPITASFVADIARVIAHNVPPPDNADAIAADDSTPSA